MSMCNRCTYNQLMRDRESETRAYLISDMGKLGGLNFYITPTSVKLFDLSEKDREKYFVAWFMELPERCTC